MVSDMIPLLATTVQKAKVCFEVAYAITRWYSVPAAGAPSSAARVSLIGQPRGAGAGVRDAGGVWLLRHFLTLLIGSPTLARAFL